MITYIAYLYVFVITNTMAYLKIIENMIKSAKAYYALYQCDKVVVLCRVDAQLILPNEFQHILTYFNNLKHIFTHWYVL